jgi:hypothetical protein
LPLTSTGGHAIDHPERQLESHIVLMQSRIGWMFSRLVFNLEEIGSSDWEDGKPGKLITLVTVSAGEVFHAVSRRYCNVTLLTYVSAADDALIQMIIFSLPSTILCGAAIFGEMRTQ